MDTVILENDFLIVTINHHGAEPTSIFLKKNNQEYLWQAGSAWPRHAPVLFPVVGQLKENKYFFERKEYFIERHGFARNHEFEIQAKEKDSVEFVLVENNETLKIFPFNFQLKIIYRLIRNKLIVAYEVQNTGSGNMFFSIGAHPAFKIPLTKTETYNDYFLEFEKKESLERATLVNGLLGKESQQFLKEEKTLLLTKELFSSDAIILKNIKSENISIRSTKSEHGIKLSFKNFPYFGIWAAKDADFVCLEPWHGIADSISHNQQLESKEGIIRLLPEENFSCKYEIEIF